MIAPAKPLDDVLEKELTTQIVDLARTLGWRRYHTHDSRRSAHGFPDEVLVRDRLILLELKREKGKLTPEQAAWITDLLNAGAEVYVVRPRDLQQIAEILAARRRPTNTPLWHSTRTEAHDRKEKTP
ncbi:MAG TPA: VRR-NUC domain-containing protein [Gaiellaceae bacterium]|nr:VRR-NUC domain-containing protein [Gaiellaceae bacterium]